MLIKLQNTYIETDNIVYISIIQIYQKRCYFSIHFKNKNELYFNFYENDTRNLAETEKYTILVREKLASYMSSDIPDVDEEVKSQESQ